MGLKMRDGPTRSSSFFVFCSSEPWVEKETPGIEMGTKKQSQ